MRVFDPLYGEFHIPSQIEGIVNSPEFRRLSQIRLLNTISPTLATLGELRRYSHTLGVLNLASEWNTRVEHNFSADEISAFYASIVLHDVATPPFGHLMEYILKSEYGWDHETAIISLLKGWHSPENIAQQIFAGKNISLVRIVKDNDISLDLLIQILTKEHPLSELILGKLDFDNMDNIARMAMSLGMKDSANLALELASNINVDRDKLLIFPISKKNLIDKWIETRKHIYTVLVFDMPTVAAQAVLSKVIKLAIKENKIDQNDWVLTDEQLLERLKEVKGCKELINRCYLGRLPKFIAAIHVGKSFLSLGKNSTELVAQEIEELAQRIGIGNPLAYVFVDNGAFSKRINFFDVNGLAPWGIGQRSKSTVLYLFTLNEASISKKKIQEFIIGIITKLNVDQSEIIDIQSAREEEINEDQGQLDL